MTVAGYYVHWGVVQISLTNLLIIAAMIVVFAAAVAFRMPGAGRRRRHEPSEVHRDEH